MLLISIIWRRVAQCVTSSYHKYHRSFQVLLRGTPSPAWWGTSCLQQKFIQRCSLSIFGFSWLSAINFDTPSLTQVEQKLKQRAVWWLTWRGHSELSVGEILSLQLCWLIIILRDVVLMSVRLASHGCKSRSLSPVLSSSHPRVTLGHVTRCNTRSQQLFTQWCL